MDLDRGRSMDCANGASTSVSGTHASDRVMLMALSPGVSALYPTATEMTSQRVNAVMISCSIDIHARVSSRRRAMKPGAAWDVVESEGEVEEAVEAVEEADSVESSPRNRSKRTWAEPSDSRGFCCAAWTRGWWASRGGAVEVEVEVVVVVVE
jgi:hypothetical protein